MQAAGHIEIPGYDVLYPLNTGGMSVVYLAMQRALERQVAIKVLNHSLGNDDHERNLLERRFLLEGRTIAKLPNRNIVAVYDIVSDGKLAYIVMEYLAGGSLAERMRSGMSLAEAISVIAQVAGALSFAHSHGVVHRDLKPTNIMFRDSATPVLTDFGIARQQGVDATRLTQTGMLIGTPTYMSPEQINGLDVDGRADLYSLGVLFYELLCGNPPFTADSPIAMLMAHLTQTPKPLPLEMAHFQGLIDRMLAKDRDQRFANMREFTSTLRTSISASSTLMIRLRSDPNHSVSEQIRALGFVNTGEEPAPAADQSPRLRASAIQPPKLLGKIPPEEIDPGEAFVNEMVTASKNKKAKRLSAIDATSASKMAKVAPKKPRYGLILATVFALALAPAGWFWLKSYNETAKQQVIAAQLRQAEQLFNDGKIIAPVGDNAIALLHEVLNKDGENPIARARLSQIAEKCRTDAEQALTNGAPKEALASIETGLTAAPEDPALTALRKRAQYALEVANPVPAVTANSTATPSSPVPRNAMPANEKTASRTAEMNPAPNTSGAEKTTTPVPVPSRAPTDAPKSTKPAPSEKANPQTPKKTEAPKEPESEELLALLPDQLDSLWHASGTSNTDFTTVERQTGCVAVGFIIESDGHTSSLRVLRAVPSAIYNEKALDAVRGWRFTPAAANNKRQAVYTYSLLTYRFGQGEEAQSVADQLAVKCKIKSLAQ